MSVTEIINSVETLNGKKFDDFYHKLNVLKIKKSGNFTLNEIEANLLSKINMDFETEKLNRLKFLDWKLENESLSAKEEIESLKLAEAYEKFSVNRLNSLSQLSIIRGVSIDRLLNQFGFN